jgi:hypothetical protein
MPPETAADSSHPFVFPDCGRYAYGRESICGLRRVTRHEPLSGELPWASMYRYC